MTTLVMEPIDFKYDTDAKYRAMIAAFKEGMNTVNPGILTQTSDTGQLSEVNAVRPAINSWSAPLLFKFDDGIGQPLFLRFQFGTTTGWSSYEPYDPALRMYVGEGTDGAGSLTGDNYLVSPATRYNLQDPADPNFPQMFSSLFSCGPGFLTFNLGYVPLAVATSKSYPSVGTARLAAALTRFCDDAGQPLPGESGWLIVCNACNYEPCLASSVDFKRSIYRSTQSFNQLLISNFYGVGGTFTYGGETQPQAVPYMDPYPKSSVGHPVLYSNEVASGAEFSATLVGLQERRYRMIGLALSSAQPYLNVGALWE